MSARMLLRSPAGAGEGSLLPDEERDGPPGSRSEAGCSWASPAFEVEPAHERVAREWLDRGVVAEEVELPAALSVVLPQHAWAGQGAITRPQRLKHEHDGRVLLLFRRGRVKLPRWGDAVLDGLDHAVGFAIGAFAPGVGAEAQYMLADPGSTTALSPSRRALPT